MAKLLKSGRVVILTAGRHAGKKALIVKSYDDGNKARKFPNALVLGVARAPRSVNRRLSKKRFTRRTSVKPFVKFVNHNHIMPTRYVINDVDTKEIKQENVAAGEKRNNLLKETSKALSQKYRNLPDPKASEKANHLRFLYRRLRF